MKAALSVLAVVAVVAIANEFLTMSVLLIGACMALWKIGQKGY